MLTAKIEENVLKKWCSGPKIAFRQGSEPKFCAFEAYQSRLQYSFTND